MSSDAAAAAAAAAAQEDDGSAEQAPKGPLSPQQQLNEALFAAVGSCNLPMVEALIEKGADPNYARGRHSCLGLAVIRCFLHIVRYLHEQGGVSIKDDPRVMHMAALGNVKNKQLLVYLKEKGADINRCDEKLGTPLMLGLYSEERDEQFARWLLDEGADVTVHQPGGERSSAVHKAAKTCSTALVRAILERGGDRLLDAKDLQGMTPLMHAAAAGRADTIELLCGDYGVDANQRSPYTPLFLAVQNGHHAAAKVLIEHGADVNFVDDEQRCCPMHLAASNSHLDIMRLLVKHGADVNVAERRGYTPLMMAGSEGYVEACTLLLDAGADMNARAGDNGRTPLHIAVEAQRPLIVQLLMRRGADTTITDAEGLTAAALATAMQAPHMLNALQHWQHLDKPEQTCGACLRKLDVAKRCSRCKRIWYCSADCQRAHWPVHKRTCAKPVAMVD